jgi:hypothetical protein
MTAFLIFSEREPLLVMAAAEAVADGRLIERLEAIGVDRFIAHEVPVASLRESYGVPFEVIESDIRRGKPVRILDSNGRHAFAQLCLRDLGPALWHDAGSTGDAQQA